jgi:DNA-directed RNA polymerase subunit N (RpoN/RPB10)
MEACENSGNLIADHFGEVTEMVAIGSGAHRALSSYQLSRYACYLIVMNGDPRKEIIALGQTYFAVKTRQQELIEDYDTLTEDQKRLSIRREMIEHNKSLAEAAQQAGVIDLLQCLQFLRALHMGQLPTQGINGMLRVSRNRRAEAPQHGCQRKNESFICIRVYGQNH